MTGSIFTSEATENTEKPVEMAERMDKGTGDRFGGRKPSRHERLTGQPWDASYQKEPPPWDIGRPQPALARVASGWAGPLLDAGCGTGEHALLAASLGLPVLGVDVAETAVATARRKAQERGLPAEFALADALDLGRLGRKFRTVVDCGLFHTFDAEDWPAYVASLAAVTDPGGTLYVLCFSDQEPGIGPHPVREDELREAFEPAGGWEIVSLVPARIHTRFNDEGFAAWLGTMRRHGGTERDSR